MKRLLLILLFATSMCYSQPIPWEPINNGFTFTNGGLVYSIAAKDSLIIVGAYHGVYLSTDYGNTWKKTSLPGDVGSNLPVTGGCLEIIGNTIFVDGIYKSTDNGSTWEESDFPRGKKIVDGNTIFAGDEKGVYISTDYGNTWKPTSLSTDSSGRKSFEITALAVSGDTVWAGTSFTSIFLSTDYGKTWEKRTNGLPVNPDTSDYPYYYSISSIVVSGNNVLASTSWIKNSLSGIYLSSNGGENWERVGLEGITIDCLTSNGSNIFAGTNGYGIYLSTDSGYSWKQSGLANHGVSSITIQSDNIYAGTGNGVYVSKDEGKNWEQIGVPRVGISKLMFKGEDIYAGNGIDRIIDSISGSGIFVSTNYGNNWETRGLKGVFISNLAVGNNILFAIQSSAINNNWDIGHLSTNNGVTWEPKFVPDLLSNSVFIRGDTIFDEGRYAVFFSTDNGDSWNNYQIYSKDVLSLKASVDKALAWLDMDGMWLTTDNWQTWKKTSFERGNILKFISSGNNIIMEMENWRTNKTERYISTDNGDTWEKLNIIELPYVPSGPRPWAISGENIFVAFYYKGLYLSTDKGNNWHSLGLYNLGISTMTTHDGYIFIGTGDDGAYKARIDELIQDVGVKAEPIERISIYPNPSTGNFTIAFVLDSPSNVEFQLYNSLAEIIFNTEGELFPVGLNKKEIDASNLTNGVYFCKLVSQSKTQYLKLIIIK